MGVSRNKANNKWKAQCRDRNGVKTYLGYFTNKHHAGEAVRKFRIKEHVEFVRHNYNPVDEEAIEFLLPKIPRLQDRTEKFQRIIKILDK